MARIRFSSGIKEVRGTIGRVVCRQVHGKSVISPKPEPRRHRKRSVAEAETNSRFAHAARCARFASPEMIARYNERARSENTTRFSVRVRDYMCPPSVPAVFTGCYTGRSGDAIFAIARDDFEVKAVRVTIRRRGGESVESGFAARTEADVFRYSATVSIPTGTELELEVVATDWPGNDTAWRTQLVV